MVYKTLIPAASASSDLAERILLHLRFIYHGTLSMERARLPVVTHWENLGFAFDWRGFAVDPWRKNTRQVDLAWITFLLLLGIGFSIPDAIYRIHAVAVLLILTAAGHLLETRRIQGLVDDGALKPDLVNQIIAGLADPREIYRHVPFIWRQIFMEEHRDNVESRVALLAMNLDWFSREPRRLLRWTWVAFTAGFMVVIAGIFTPQAWFLMLLTGAQISLLAYAACCWRRRVLLGVVISYIEEHYIGNPVEEFANQEG